MNKGEREICVQNLIHQTIFFVINWFDCRIKALDECNWHC